MYVDRIKAINYWVNIILVNKNYMCINLHNKQYKRYQIDRNNKKYLLPSHTYSYQPLISLMYLQRSSNHLHITCITHSPHPYYPGPMDTLWTPQAMLISIEARAESISFNPHDLEMEPNLLNSIQDRASTLLPPDPAPELESPSPLGCPLLTSP